MATLAGVALTVWNGLGGGNAPAGHAGRPTVVFVVLDTVRSDHLSLCGYSRPTSPNLDRLARDANAFTCDAYAPGSWTMPSHASFFTGEEVTAHGAGVRPGAVELEWGRKFNPLDEALPTLAERMQQAGYQTVALSGNPVLMQASGLMRGFDVWRSAESFGQLQGEDLTTSLKQLLDQPVDPSGGPLFLFINIADAHTPWAPVPVGIDWLPPQPALAMSLARDSSFRRYLTGELTPGEATEFLRAYTNAYDYGVYRADHTLGLVLDELTSQGWFRDGRRLIVTSDHGEFLGDHGLVGHGAYLHEGNARVPLVVVGKGPALDLTGRVGAIESFGITLGESRLPRPFVQSVAFPSHRKAAALRDNAAAMRRELDSDRANGLYLHTSAALWQGDEKLRWTNGEFVRFDLASDPTEQQPLPLGEHPLRASLAALAQQAVALSARLPTERDEQNKELEERLRALGYAE